MSSTNQSVVKSSPSMMIHLDIMDRLRQIQLIQQALEMAESSYSRIKQSNPMFDATLTQAESMANQLAMPVINKLEQPSKFFLVKFFPLFIDLIFILIQ